MRRSLAWLVYVNARAGNRAKACSRPPDLYSAKMYCISITMPEPGCCSFTSRFSELVRPCTTYNLNPFYHPFTACKSPWARHLELKFCQRPRLRRMTPGPQSHMPPSPHIRCATMEQRSSRPREATTNRTERGHPNHHRGIKSSPTRAGTSLAAHGHLSH
jgi:hypothetical protein